MLVKWSAIRESGMRGARALPGVSMENIAGSVQAEAAHQSGNIVKWYGSSIDIEDRKRTEMLCARVKHIWPRRSD
jgi:hypothetical protein